MKINLYALLHDTAFWTYLIVNVSIAYATVIKLVTMIVFNRRSIFDYYKITFLVGVGAILYSSLYARILKYYNLTKYVEFMHSFFWSYRTTILSAICIIYSTHKTIKLVKYLNKKRGANK